MNTLEKVRVNRIGAMMLDMIRGNPQWSRKRVLKCRRRAKARLRRYSTRSV